MGLTDKFLLGLCGVLIALCVLVFVAILPSCTTAELTPYSAADTLPNDDSKPQPVVRLVDHLTGDFFCSGTVISRHYILTAAHCLEGRKKVNIRTSDGRDLKTVAIVAGAEPRSDQGLLYGDFTAFNTAKIVTSSVGNLSAWVNSQVIVTCGFPYGGKLLCLRALGAQQLVFQIASKGFLFPGMSGGPVINGETGEIIGVNTAAGEGYIVFSPILEIFSNLHVKEVE